MTQHSHEAEQTIPILTPKACPFCAKNNIRVRQFPTTTWAVECADVDCLYSGVRVVVQGRTEAEAVEAWNRRSEVESRRSSQPAQRCPICEGLGVVQFNPALPTSTTQSSGGPWTCPTCNGLRIIAGSRLSSEATDADRERLDWLEARNEFDVREGPDGATIGLLSRSGKLIAEGGNLRAAIDSARRVPTPVTEPSDDPNHLAEAGICPECKIPDCEHAFPAPTEKHE